MSMDAEPTEQTTTESTITLMCTQCGVIVQTEIHRGQIIIPRCLKCRQFVWEMRGAISGVVGAPHHAGPETYEPQPSQRLDVLDLLHRVLLANRQRMGDGSRSERFCLACVQRWPHKQPGDCPCPCHAGWALIHAADEASRAA